MAQQAQLYFYGGVGTVTGSNFLLDVGDAKLLIDCGLFQGEHTYEENSKPFPYKPEDIAVLINTHAHMDHIGRIPKLVREGYRGPILSTEATKALVEPMLLDALALDLADARHKDRAPLYSKEDVAQALAQWQTLSYHEARELPGGMTLEFLNSGHILGSAMAKLSRGGKSIVFTGDLGGGNSPLLAPAEVPLGTNYLVMESVYGDRMREDDKHRRDLLENIIEDAVARGGTLLIPAFSTERTQDLLFEIRSLMLEKRVPEVPVYLDSPLAEKITAAFLRYPRYFTPEVAARIEAGEDIFAFPGLRFVADARESQHILEERGPKILLAGSGMSSGGRVLSHEARVLPDERATVLIVGYQAAGSLGRKLIGGATSVRIHREEVPVRAHVEAMYGYSAHMQGEQLLEFVNKIGDAAVAGQALREVFVVMGELAASSFLVQRIRDYLGVRAVAPALGESATLEL